MAQNPQQIGNFASVGYGLTNALQTLSPVPVISGDNHNPGRAPGVNDKLQIGQLWVWAPQDAVYILTSIVNNQAQWQQFGAGGINPLFINLPDTNATATEGYISFNNVVYLSNFGTDNVFLGALAGHPGSAAATGSDNTGMGWHALFARTTGASNTAYGSSTLTSLTTGANNVAVGFTAGNLLTTGNSNVMVGRLAGTSMTTGSRNVFVGDDVADSVLTGTDNIIIGNLAGDSYVGAESSNVVIENSGVAAESNTIRIGTAGAGAGQQNRCFIAGIRGITTGVADAVAVLIDSTGQLGTVSSSGRFKDNIQEMPSSLSSKIYDLVPVTFSYKSDATHKQQVGLIAEQVAQVMPDLVVLDAAGFPETVKYHELPVLLLAEIRNLKAELAALKQGK